MVAVVSGVRAANPVTLWIAAIASAALLLPSSAGAEIVGGTAHEREVLAGIIATMRTPPLYVEISVLPKTPSHGVLRELIFTRPASAEPLDAETSWKTWVITGVARARGLRFDIGAPRGVGRFVPTTRKQVRTILRRAARSARVQVNRIDLLAPLAIAPVVTVTVRDLDALARFRAAFGTLLNYEHPRVEGIFLIVRHRSGRAWVCLGTSVRLSSGVSGC